VAHGFTISRENYRVAPTITNDRQVTSIEDKTFPFVFLDEFLNGLVNLDVLLPFHGGIRLCLGLAVVRRILGRFNPAKLIDVGVFSFQANPSLSSTWQSW
jgi:hypothetical protein